MVLGANGEPASAADAEFGVVGSDTLLRNNIINQNVVNRTVPVGIAVDASSLTGYDGDYDLNTDAYVGASAGLHDIDADPLFISPGSSQPDLHVLGRDLSGGGGGPAIDASDPDTDPDLVALLEQGTVLPLPPLRERHLRVSDSALRWVPDAEEALPPLSDASLAEIQRRLSERLATSGNADAEITREAEDLFGRYVREAIE